MRSGVSKKKKPKCKRKPPIMISYKEYTVPYNGKHVRYPVLVDCQFGFKARGWSRGRNEK